MNAHRRQSFCGFATSLERKKDDKYGREKQRKFSAASQTYKINKAQNETELGGLRRASSLPDCKEIARMQSKRLPHSKAISVTETPVVGGMKRARSVSFAPEVVLFAAVAENDVNELRKIMAKDEVDINHQSASGLTALHYASAEGSYECVQILLESGAEVELVDSQGCTALDFAVRGGHFDCASYLIRAGAGIKKIVNGL
ncbi:protein phosphatase 1 regulatory subunit 16A-like [Montipora foliosa]|uniref:protein phosphatase 1 regulatory subunit 16A-like n=1 Tax=Montipora foliosa TaxID=591990 RepID=UPI0035F1C014